LPARVLVVGSINMDLIVRCERVPGPGETLHGAYSSTAPGGKGANQAVSCARLNAETVMIGRVGDDEFGRRLRAGLEQGHIDVTRVRVDPRDGSGFALILLEEKGQNRIVVIPGVNARMGEEEVEAAATAMGQADVVLMQLEVPLPVVKAIAETARERGVRCVLDAGAATPEAAEMGLPALVDVISPNEAETQALTGMSVASIADAGRAARRLRAMGAKDVVLKLGEQGAYWTGPEGEEHFPAFPIDPVDTTAAGDAFTGCLAVGLAEGRPMAEAITRANAAGALACLTLGAQPSMPTLQAVERFLAGQV
jgi:ribokinase